MKTVYVNKEGVICACTVPFPNEKDFSGDQWKENAALQACKESAVPFDEQDHAFHALYLETKTDYKINATFSEWFNNFPKPDTFYQIEADWEIVEIMNHRSSPTAASVALYKVARLKVPAPTVATDNSGEKPIKVTFGLQASHIEVIERERQRWKDIKLSPELMKYKSDPIYSKAFWDQTAKLVGWCPFTLAMYYLGRNEKALPVEEEQYAEVFKKLGAYIVSEVAITKNQLEVFKKTKSRDMVSRCDSAIRIYEKLSDFLAKELPRKS